MKLKALLCTACVFALLGLAAQGPDAQHRASYPSEGYPVWVMDTIATTTAVLDTIWAPSGYRIANLRIYSNLGQPVATVRESLWVKFTYADTTSPVSCTDSIMLITGAGAVAAGAATEIPGLSWVFPVSCVRIELAGPQAVGAVASAHWAYIAYMIRTPNSGHGGVSWP